LRLARGCAELGAERNKLMAKVEWSGFSLSAREDDEHGLVEVEGTRVWNVCIGESEEARSRVRRVSLPAESSCGSTSSGLGAPPQREAPEQAIE